MYFLREILTVSLYIKDALKKPHLSMQCPFKKLKLKRFAMKTIMSNRNKIYPEDSGIS
jgi:hypothetical protein